MSLTSEQAAAKAREYARTFAPMSAAEAHGAFGAVLQARRLVEWFRSGVKPGYEGNIDPALEAMGDEYDRIAKELRALEQVAKETETLST
jgi:hypothetical protein